MGVAEREEGANILLQIILLLGKGRSKIEGATAVKLVAPSN